MTAQPLEPDLPSPQSRELSLSCSMTAAGPSFGGQRRAFHHQVVQSRPISGASSTQASRSGNGARDLFHFVRRIGDAASPSPAQPHTLAQGCADTVKRRDELVGCFPLSVLLSHLSYVRVANVRAPSAISPPISLRATDFGAQPSMTPVHDFVGHSRGRCPMVSSDVHQKEWLSYR